MISNPTRRRIRRFTLVEIMAAMVVLLILMGFLFKFLWSAQQAWSLSDRNSRIYENAQIAMDLIGRDLKSAVASNVPGAEIPCWKNPGYNNTTAEQDRFCVVSATSAVNTNQKTGLAEVGYALTTDVGDSHAHWLTRSVMCDRTGSGSNEHWDFFGVTSGDAWTDIPVVVADGGPRSNWSHRIINGVTGFDVYFLGYDGDAGGGDAGTANRLPKAIRISLMLVDPKGVDESIPEPLRAEIVRRSQRTFTKMIFLGTD